MSVERNGYNSITERFPKLIPRGEEEIFAMKEEETKWPMIPFLLLFFEIGEVDDEQEISQENRWLIYFSLNIHFFLGPSKVTTGLGSVLANKRSAKTKTRKSVSLDTFHDLWFLSQGQLVGGG